MKNGVFWDVTPCELGTALAATSNRRLLRKKISLIEKCSDFIGNQVHVLAACSIMPEPTRVTRASWDNTWEN
jgi:hypothetical protein